MDFSVPSTTAEAPRHIKPEYSDSEDENMTGGAPLITLGEMSSGPALSAPTPATFFQNQNHQGPVSESQNPNYFGGLSEERMAALALSEPEEVKEPHTRGGRRSRAAKRERGKMVNWNKTEVKMEIGDVRPRGESRRRRGGPSPSDQRRKERRAAAKQQGSEKEGYDVAAEKTNTLSHDEVGYDYPSFAMLFNAPLHRITTVINKSLGA